MRVREEMMVPAESGFQRFTITVLYGWLPQGRLVPVEFSLASVSTEGHVLQSRGRYSHYRMFTAESKIVIADKMP